MFNPFKFTPEHQAEIEKPLETEVKLEIFRHSKRENDTSRPNSELLLTPEGRELAQKKGLQFNSDVNVAVAGASSMDRAAETAILTMLANEEKIDVSASLEEMDSQIAEELKVGKKIYRDDRLGFNTEGPVHDEQMAGFNSGRYMEWLVKDSDRQAIEKGDEVTTTYLRQAGNIAELIEKYSKISTNFNRLASEKKKEDEEFPLHLERYLVTHQGVTESFMSELIKLQEGAEAQTEFLRDLKNGWAETEGISVRILNKGQEQSMSLSYPDKGGRKEIEVAKDMITKIINRRATFENAVKTSVRASKNLKEGAKI